MTSRRPPSALRLVVLLLVGALLPWASAGADTRDQLDSTRQQIDQTIEQLRSVDAEAAQTEEQVAAAEERVDDLETALNELLSQLQAQEQRVTAARQQAEQAEAERSRIASLLNERARRAFMQGSPDPVMLISGQGMGDVSGALDNIALLETVTARDNASIETLDVARVRADATAARLDEEVDQLEEVRAAREEVLLEAEEVLAQRAEALGELESQSEALLARQEELEDDEAELQDLIRREEEAARRRQEEQRRAAEEAAQAAAEEAEAAQEQVEETSQEADEAVDEPAAPPPSSGGCYQWPANGAVTSEYGPRWGRMHRGIDIDGDTGDPLYAAQSGTVTYAGYYSGYGNLTLIRHDDGVTTAYAHQSSFGVSQGQNVARGEYIGAMGATGNVTGSHLHFETRTSSGAVNPRNYLC